MGFGDYHDVEMVDVPVTSGVHLSPGQRDSTDSQWRDVDLVHSNRTTSLNHSPNGFANVPSPDGSFPLVQNPSSTPGTSRLSTPARAGASPKAGHHPQARNAVGTPRQWAAAIRRRQAQARIFCDFPGCKASFTRGHNYRSS